MLGPTHPTTLTSLLCFCLPTNMGAPEEASWTLPLASPEERSGTEVRMANTSGAPTGLPLWGLFIMSTHLTHNNPTRWVALLPLFQNRKLKHREVKG